jgi:adenosylhomocysteine nucleosidase
MIAIISVAQEETGLFKSQMSADAEEIHAGQTLYTGKLDSADIVLACCGSGEVSSAVALQEIIDHYNIEMVISTGPAGPLVPYLQQGDIVIADRQIEFYDSDLDAGDQDDDSRSNESLCIADKVLISRAKDAYDVVFGTKSNRPQLILGTMISSDKAISDLKTIGRLQRDHGVIAFDKEGAAISRVCRTNHKPFLIIRNVVDSPDGDFFNQFDLHLQVVPEYITALVRCFIAAPQPVPVV